MEIQNCQDKVEEKPLTASSPPSSSSSPAHEFSFTISPHQPPPPTTAHNHSNPPPPPFTAVDLSPADEIFFHGHLLPLHLLSHLPISPRSSTNSLDSFTLPIHQLLLQDQTNPHQNNTNFVNTNEPQGRVKSNSFSLFGLSKWRKGYKVKEKEDQEKQKKKLLKFDVNNVLKRYIKMVKPLLPFRGSRNRQFHRQTYLFSDSLSSRGKQDQFRGRRGEFSAPASMRTSPTNSGLLVATGAIASSTSDSTMEELQAGIQAAITHCKNSIAMEDKIKCQD